MINREREVTKTLAFVELHVMYKYRNLTTHLITVHVLVFISLIKTTYGKKQNITVNFY